MNKMKLAYNNNKEANLDSEEVNANHNNKRVNN